MYISKTAVVNASARIGWRTKVWDLVRVMQGAVVGDDCVLGQGVHVGPGVRIGSGCHIQNGAQIFSAIVKNDVFIGPGAVFTNIQAPRAFRSQHGAFKTINIAQGATVGANATLLPGVKIGAFAVVGAGAVVTKDVGEYEIVVGNPARLHGYACLCGNVAARKDSLGPWDPKTNWPPTCEDC